MSLVYHWLVILQIHENNFFSLNKSLQTCLFSIIYFFLSVFNILFLKHGLKYQFRKSKQKNSFRGGHGQKASAVSLLACKSASSGASVAHRSPKGSLLCFLQALVCFIGQHKNDLECRKDLCPHVSPSPHPALEPHSGGEQDSSLPYPKAESSILLKRERFHSLTALGQR